MDWTVSLRMKHTVKRPLASFDLSTANAIKESKLVEISRLDVHCAASYLLLLSGIPPFWP